MTSEEFYHECNHAATDLRTLASALVDTAPQDMDSREVDFSVNGALAMAALLHERLHALGVITNE